MADRSPGFLFGTARLRASQLRPYFSVAMAAMQPVPVVGLGTMAVDQYWRCYYDPQTTEDWQEKAASVVVHELAHLLRGHHRRAVALGTSIHPKAWAWGTDAEINDSDFGPDMPLPGNPIVPSVFGAPDGLLAEQYHDMLVANPPDEWAAGQRSDQGGSPTGSNDGRDDGSSPSSRTSAGGSGGKRQAPAAGPPDPSTHPDGETIPGRSCAPQDAPDAHGGCGGGSGVDGQPRPWELPADHKDHPGLTETEAHLIRRQVAQAIKSHVKSRGIGSVPGNWRRWADEILEPAKVPWTQELASTLRGQLSAAGVQDYSYGRPSRRRVRGVVLPAMRARRPKVGIVIDTSGSMGDDDVNKARGEVQGICRSHQAEVLVVTVDAAVQTRQRVTNVRQVEIGGGGGTDMGVGLAELEKAACDVIVVLTDGYTPWPSKPTAARTIVCLLGQHRADASGVPSWARAIVRGD